MRRLAAVLFPLLVLSASAAPGAAQARFQVTPFGGGMVFASDLSDAFSLGDIDFEGQTLNNSVALGVHAGVRFGSIAVEGTVAYAPATMVSISDAEFDQDVKVAVFSDQDVLILGANALFYLPRSSPFFEFFLTGGGGIKKYSQADPFGGWEDGASDPTFNLGAGLQLAVSPTVSMRIDLRDYISSFDPGGGLEKKTQQDILIAAGVTFHPGS